MAIMSGLGFAAMVGLLFASAPVTIPACDNYFAQSGLKDVVATSPAGKAAGLAVVTLADVKELSRTPTEARCTARARMNNVNVVSLVSVVFKPRL
ncbi:hypothetical protein [Bradyrhizobium glycinis]|uniref:hypothetical protein n=1 Tax=Bradyrhizobium glycinis TaxID=2751812 RepID=UPI0018D61A4E|nr:hypothetical protein [Bradyrhizobium glycinis]MBH5373135.1 hypothetical protein [Bradyrhizobium glycinis]